MRNLKLKFLKWLRNKNIELDVKLHNIIVPRHIYDMMEWDNNNYEEVMKLLDKQEEIWGKDPAITHAKSLAKWLYDAEL